MSPRPVFLNVLQIRLPITALTSIGHRISGIVMFLLLPLMLYLIFALILPPQDYAHVMSWFHLPAVRIWLMIWLASLGFHQLAGLRHMAVDVGWLSCQKDDSRRSAFVLWVLFIIYVLALGYWVW